MNKKSNEPLRKVNGEPIVDTFGRPVIPPDPESGLPVPWSPAMDDETLEVIFQYNESLTEQYRIQTLLEKNIESEKTQECWGDCNCKKK
jgi:hypothetical protein